VVEIAGKTYPARTGEDHIADGQDVVVTGFDHSVLIVREATSHDRATALVLGPSSWEASKGSNERITINPGTQVLGCLSGIIGFVVWVIALCLLGEDRLKWLGPGLGVRWLGPKLWMLGWGLSLAFVWAIVFGLIYLLSSLFRNRRS
jgi:hypothetical protein